MGRQIGAAELALHSSTRDCWIVIHGKVYDCTKYLEDHPGGVEIITDLAGKDATEEYDDVGHSEEANDQLKSLYIGDFNASAPAPSGSAPAAASAPATPAPKPVEAPKPAPAPKPVEVAKPAPAPYVPPAAPVSSSSSSSNTNPSKGGPAFKDEGDSTMMFLGAGIVAAGVAFAVYRKLQG